MPAEQALLADYPNCHKPPAAALLSPRTRDLRVLAANRADQVGACRQCVWRRFCYDACLGLAWQQTGDWQRTDDLRALLDSLFTQTTFQCAEWKEQCAHDACEGDGEFR